MGQQFEVWRCEMRFRLRHAESGDSVRIKELVRGVLGEYGIALDESGVDADMEDVGASYVGSGGCFHVLIDDDGRIVGTVGLMPKGNGVAELRKMYLRREARGRGLGKMMLRTVLEDARRLGFRRITLETATSMKEAQGLYESHGFRRLACGVETSRCDRVYELELGGADHSPMRTGGASRP